MAEAQGREIRWPGLALAGLGGALALVSFFVPWIVIYKIEVLENGAVNYLTPRRGYSPWTALWRGPVDSLTVMVALFMAVIVVALWQTARMGMARSARVRSRAGALAVMLAALGLVMASVGMWGVPMVVSFSYPYFDHDGAPGGWLAVAGLILVGIGVALTGPWDGAQARPVPPPQP